METHKRKKVQNEILALGTDKAASETRRDGKQLLGSVQKHLKRGDFPILRWFKACSLSDTVSHKFLEKHAENPEHIK